MTEPSGSILTALFADGDEKLRRAVGAYAAEEQGVRIVEIVATGGQVLELLQNGLQVDALIVDTLLPDMDVFEFLSQLGRLCLKDPPTVILTLCAASDAMRSKLLTAGADYFILKPYWPSTLLRAVSYAASDLQSVQQRRARAHINWHLDSLKAPPGMEGRAYIRRLLLELVLNDDTATADELYRGLAMELRTTPNTVSKAIGRTVQAIWRQATPEYRKLCDFFGEGRDRPLSNMKLIKGLAERIRWELGM